ncbi:hypothetical protein BU25DRAFT_421200 [Macroventuria anomochaeta]|uniref:Uncharacterized protein n=1 Tax=Macroventuria anomochaeta TaxID=301207 RepID=A0ACB6S493_9PLEO|nr:uncharacterized protein BU25DRAFT_421200 [Macroventuria anomochaeta]KAF2628214.1 hypothetical protein BU25DRAFT_421200 [Macroventuria anomochaeta]
MAALIHQPFPGQQEIVWAAPLVAKSLTRLRSARHRSTTYQERGIRYPSRYADSLSGWRGRPNHLLRSHEVLRDARNAQHRGTLFDDAMQPCQSPRPTTNSTTIHKNHHFAISRTAHLHHIFGSPRLPENQLAPGLRKSHGCGSALLTSGSLVARSLLFRQPQLSPREIDIPYSAQQSAPQQDACRGAPARKLCEALNTSTLRQPCPSFAGSRARRRARRCMSANASKCWMAAANAEVPWDGS